MVSLPIPTVRTAHSPLSSKIVAINRTWLSLGFHAKVWTVEVRLVCRRVIIASNSMYVRIRSVRSRITSNQLSYKLNFAVSLGQAVNFRDNFSLRALAVEISILFQGPLKLTAFSLPSISRFTETFYKPTSYFNFYSRMYSAYSSK